MEDFRTSAVMDVLYSELLTHIKPLARDDPVFDLICNGVKNTHADAHNSFKVAIRNIFSIEKPSEKLSYLPFEKNLPNKFLLWAGCRSTSLVATLREGLRMPT